jgi:hypothetical protein
LGHFELHVAHVRKTTDLERNGWSMKNVLAYAALASLSVGFIGASFARANAEIETFDSPNELQVGGGNYVLNRDGGSYTSGNGAVQTFGTDNYELATHPATGKGGYGTGYHNIFTQNTPPAGGSNGVIDISGNTYLQLDVTINNGTDAGLFIDLLDGEGDFYQYFYGYGRTGNAANDIAAGVQPGEIITQGALPNEEIMDVPLATPFSDLNGTGMFDLTQLTLYRIENDPGTPNGTGNPSDVSFYDLSAVNLPEPTSLGIGAVTCILAARRRRH